MYRYQQTLGIDLGRTQARVVRMTRRGFGLALRDAVSVPLPSDPAEAARVLRGFLENRGWRRLPCVVGIRGEGILLRVVQTPPNDTRSAEAVVAEEMDRFLGSSPAESCRDQADIRTRENRQVVFALARSATIQAHLQAAHEAELNVVDCVPAAIALFNAAAWAFPSGGAFVAADLDDRETELALGRDRELRFVRRFPSGRISLVEGAAPSTPEVEAGQLPGWPEEFRACLEYYRAHFRGEGEGPVRLVLAGPDPGQEVVTALEATSGLSVRRFAESERMEALTGRSEFAVAVGLGLAGLGVAPVRISLLPAAAREDLALRGQLAWWALTGLALVLGGGVLVAGYRHNADRQRAQQAVLQETLARLQQTEARWRQLAGVNAEAQRRLAPLRAATWNNHTADAVLAALTLAKHGNDWVTLVADAASYGSSNAPVEPRPVPGMPREGTTAIRQFVVEGYTPA